jgi:hypothetical protein
MNNMTKIFCGMFVLMLIGGVNAQTEWTTQKGNNARTGFTSATGVINISASIVNTYGNAQFFFNNPIVFADRVLLEDSENSNHQVIVFNRTNISLGVIDSIGMSLGQYASTPAVDTSTGYVYMCDNYLFEYRGTPLSSAYADITFTGFCEYSSPMVVDGFAYLTGDSDVLVETNASTMAWHNNVDGIRGFAYDSGAFYIVTSDYNAIRKTDSGFTILYTTAVGNLSPYMTPAVGDSVVYITTTDGRVIGLNKTDLSVVYTYSVPSESFYTSPSVGGGHVYVGGENGMFYEFPEDLSSIQHNKSLGSLRVFDSVVTPTAVYVGSRDNQFWELEPDNIENVIGNYGMELDEGYNVVPAVVDDNVYVGRDVLFYQFQNPPTTTTTTTTTTTIPPHIQSCYIYVPGSPLLLGTSIYFSVYYYNGTNDFSHLWITLNDTYANGTDQFNPFTPPTYYSYPIFTPTSTGNYSVKCYINDTANNINWTGETSGQWLEVYTTTTTSTTTTIPPLIIDCITTTTLVENTAAYLPPIHLKAGKIVQPTAPANQPVQTQQGFFEGLLDWFKSLFQ